MNTEFQKALDKKRIISFAKATTLIKGELKQASDDLKEALDRLKNHKYKYATITGYYSMFHSARALLYSKGYREKSHYYLVVALESLFVGNGLLEEIVVKEFRDAMVLREDADYHGSFSKEGAENVLKFAKELLIKAKELLKK
ncbi:MAG: HEPN domain-containing protein [Candidatus Omnitrophota bacterium]